MSSEMIAMTTNNSISVKALRARCVCMLTPRVVWPSVADGHDSFRVFRSVEMPAVEIELTAWTGLTTWTCGQIGRIRPQRTAFGTLADGRSEVKP